MDDPRRLSLAVGAGGRATNRFIREEILSRFHAAPLQELEDGSLVEAGSESLVVTTDSYIVDPPFFSGGSIGKLAAAGTINDLVASGARPRFCTMGLVVGEGFEYGSLQQILDDFAGTAESAQMQTVAGDTKVVEQNANIGVCINVTGIGVSVRPERRYRLADARIGDAILITGTVGDHALAVLSQREGLGFESRVVSDCAPLNALILPALEEDDSIHALRDPTRGGLAGVLHDLARVTETEILLDESSVPVQKEVAFGCEMLGLKPIELINEGKMVIVADPEAAPGLIERLRRHPLGRNAASVGRIERSAADRGRVIVRSPGGDRLLQESEGAPQPRLC